MIKAIIFDMDGLLVDSEPYWDRARQKMAAWAGKTWNEDDHKAVMGTSTQEWVAYMTRRLELTLSAQEVQDQIVENLLELYREKIPFLPGAVEAVNLAAQHFPAALASGAHPHLIDIVTHDPRMLGKFQLIISADEIGAGKPAPDIYLEAARRLGVQPEIVFAWRIPATVSYRGKRPG